MELVFQFFEHLFVALYVFKYTLFPTLCSDDKYSLIINVPYELSGMALANITVLGR
jgi:hypothetical protein